MRRFLIFFVLFTSLLSGLAQESTAKYLQQKIYWQGTTMPELEPSVTDLQLCLQRATGKTFSLLSVSGIQKEGIQLLLLRPGLLPAALSQKLEKGTIEDFVIQGSASRLLIIATHPVGLSKGIYTYLDQLGFKWYLPGEEWSITPMLKSIILATTAYSTPSFKIRNFFGTGGLMPVKPLDPDGALEKKWEAWKRRNRFGGQYHFSGHYGETFNIKYKELLQKTPRYLAQVGGKRQWSEIAKWCISNKEFRTLFIADRVQELEQRLRASAYSTELIPVTVDPADGYGDCECDACRKMGSVNDRIYFLANETAIALQKRSARGYANIYAYNTHPSPPSFALSDHLIVQVVPYAFQTIAKPEELIAAWKKRNNNLFIYDYYGIPDWHQDTPLTDGWNTENFLKRLPFWTSQSLKGFVFETSYGSGCTGLGLYVAGRLGWNASEKQSVVQDAFIKDLFGTAAPHVALYYQKLQNGFGGVADIPFLLDQLKQASNSTTDKNAAQRLAGLKAYVHYLILWYKYKSPGAGRQSLENLYRYLFQIYPRAVVHSTYLALLLHQQFEAGSDVAKAWALYEPVGKNVAQTKFLNDAEIEGIFADDLKGYPMLRGFTYLPKSSKLQYGIRQPKAQNGMMKEGLLILNLPETIVKPSADGTIIFSIKVNEASTKNNAQSFFIQLADAETGAEVTKQKTDITKNWKEVKFKATPGKTYRLVINNTNWMRLSVPATQWLAFKNIPMYAVLGPLWFYNESAEYLYFSNSSKEQLVVRDAKGTVMPIEKTTEPTLFRIAIRPGTWCSIEATEYKALRFFDTNLLFFPYANMAAN